MKIPVLTDQLFSGVKVCFIVSQLWKSGQYWAQRCVATSNHPESSTIKLNLLSASLHLPTPCFMKSVSTIKYRRITSNSLANLNMCVDVLMFYGHTVFPHALFTCFLSWESHHVAGRKLSEKSSLFGVSVFTLLDLNSSVRDHITARCCLFASGFHSVSAQKADLNDKAEPDESAYDEAWAQDFNANNVIILL